MERVPVTGGAGRLGRLVVRELVGSGREGEPGQGGVEGPPQQDVRDMVGDMLNPMVQDS